MDRRQFLLHLMALSASPLINACSSQQSLKVSILPWVGYETLRLAKNLNWLPDHIDLIENHNAADKISGLFSHQIDAGCMTIGELLRARDLGIDLTAITVFNFSAGADMVIAKPSITSLADLSGKKIGLEKSGTAVLMLAKLLEHAQISHEDVEISYCNLNEQVSLWQQHQVDVMISYRPIADSLIANHGHVIFDSLEVPNTIIDVLAVRTELLFSHAKPLRTLVKAHFAGIQHINYNYHDAIYRFAANQNTTVAAVKTALSGIIQPSLQTNHAFLSEQSTQFHTIADEVSNILVAYNLISQPSNLANICDDSFLPSTSDTARK